MLRCTKQHDLAFIIHTLLYFINGHIRIRRQNSSYFCRGSERAREQSNQNFGARGWKRRVRVGLRACEARALFARISLRPFASLQNRLWKKNDCFPVYIRSSASESRKKKAYFTQKPCITTRALITTNSECKCTRLIGYFRVASSLCFKAK